MISIWLAVSHPFFLSGYTKTFANKAGLIESGLGGSCAPAGTAPTPGSNEEAEEEKEDDDSDVPFADGDKKPAAAKTTPKKKSVAEAVDDLAGDFEEFTIKDTGKTKDMQIKVVHKPDVRVKRDVVRYRDLLMVQIRVNGGAVLDTFKIQPDPENTNKVAVSCDMDPNLSNGIFCTKDSWHHGNSALAKELQDNLDNQCKVDTVPGCDFERDTDSFEWPKGLKSTVIPCDPHQIGFRLRPTPLDESLYEIERVVVKGLDGDTVVPCFLISAFFFVDIPTARRANGGLRIKTPPGNRHTKRSRRDEDDDDDEDMEDSKPAASTPKKAPPSAGLFTLFGLLGSN